MYFYNSSNNTINNSQAYNNGYGFFFINNSSQYNTINYCQIYNNIYWIEMNNSPFNAINNTQLYSNTYAIDTNIESNIYYGTLQLFHNGSHFKDQLPIAWSDTDFFSGWILEQSWTMSCDLITNPMNSNDLFLQTEAGCLERWRINDRTWSTIGYVYGTSLMKQTAVLQDTWVWSNAYSWSTLTVDTNKYITEYNPLISGSMVIASGQTYTIDRSIHIQLTAAESVDYVLVGDFEESPMAGTLTDTETKNITLTTWYETKHISVTYSTGERTRTFNKQIDYVDWDGLPYFYFRSWSTYTQHWTGNSCDLNNMSVVYVDPWTNSIPNHLSQNTIYVANPWAYTITDDYIYPSHCSALIGSGNVTIYSDGYFSRIIFFTEVTSNIVDNIKVDGTNNGNWGTHGTNIAGIQVYDSNNNTISNAISFSNSIGILVEWSTNNTISNAQTYDNNNGGIYLTNASYNTITDVETDHNYIGFNVSSSSSYNILSGVHTYNNFGIWMYMQYSSHNTITNTQSYNNGEQGIYLYDNCNSNIINNVQIYNNTNHWLLLEGSSNNNTISNTQIHNNLYWLFLQSVYNTTLYNSQIYNNAGDGITIHYSPATVVNSDIYNNGGWIDMYPSGPREVKYYGTVNIFANTTDVYADQFTAWDETEFFSWGVLSTAWTMSCDLITNPMNTDGIFLVNVAQYPTCNLRWKNSSRSGNQMSYLYGADIFKQTHIIKDDGTNGNHAYSWSNLSFDATKYIAEVNVLLNWSLLVASGQTYTFDTGIQVQLTVAEPADYVLSGDFEESPITGTLIDSGIETKDITLTTWYETKHISVTYSTWWRTRTISKTIGYPDPEGLPTLYFGSWSEYTKNRNTNTCNPAAMTVEYISPGTDTIPQYLSGNTLYILLDWSYIITTDGGWITMTTCSALIGSGDVTIYSQNQLDRMLLIHDNNNTIIDNVSLDGQYNGNDGQHSATYYGILLDNASNNTINAVEVYNNAYYWMYLVNHSTYNAITNSQSYNNQQCGIHLYDYTNHNMINNVQTYNNGQDGIKLVSASSNTINNTQTYNNDNDGILFYYYSTDNIINNSQSYNNSNHGIYISDHSSNSTSNNSQSYNNRNFGIYIDWDCTNNTYYGAIKLFGNGEDINDISNISAWSESEIFSWWVVDREGTMSCSRVTNPINNDGTFLIDEETYPECNSRWRKSREASSDTKYLYGENILKQINPINKTTIDDETIFSLPLLSFDPAKYIAEVNATLNGWLSLASGQSYVIESGVQVQLTTNELVYYVLSGDFIWAPISGTLYGTTTGIVYLTGWYGIKSITVTYSTGDKERSITKNIWYISSLDNYCELITDIPRWECDALIALYTSTNWSGWSDKDNWFGEWDITPTTACDRYGVSCNNGEEWSYIYSIDLSENNLSGNIPAQIHNLTHLEYLYLDDNTISRIESDAFSGLAHLYEMTLAYNQLTNIASGTFYNLPYLQYLYLDNNAITTIGSGAFEDLPNLYRLNMVNNHISGIANGMFVNLPYLNQLELSHNQINSIESGAFSELSNMENLYLDYNIMETVKKGMFYGLSNLYYLNMTSSQTTHLESWAFEGLPRLDQLNLSYNQIDNIEIGAFSGLANLEYLNLGNNTLSSILPGIFDELADLYQLTLSYNQISDIASGARSGLSNLQYLYLTNNLMINIPSNIFNGLANLNVLDLSNNQISDIEHGARSGLSRLQYLYLGGNFLTTISSGIFEGMDYLNYLNLSFNTITSMDNSAFSSLPMLQQLYLNYNQLSWSLDSLCLLTGLYLLYLDNNHFAGDIPSCLTWIRMDRWWNISYNYLDTNVEDPSDLLNYLNSYFWGWRNQYLLSDILLSWTVTHLAPNSFILNLWYHNAGPRSLDNTTIYYDMIDGLDITADMDFVTWTTATTYPWFDDPCLAEWYNDGTGPYQEFFDEYARNEDEYDNLTDMLCDREGFYCGSNDGAGKYLIDYIISDDWPITDRREAFIDRFDDEDADIGYIPNCWVPWKWIYIFDLGTLDANSGGTIVISWTFSDELVSQWPIVNTLEIFSPEELRWDLHIRDNRFWFTYNEGDISIDDRTSLFTDLPDSAAIVTDTISLPDVIANTSGISIRSDNIEAYLPPRIRVTTSGQVCDDATLLPPQDKTVEIKAVDPTITAAFQIWSACSGTTLIFNRPIRIRIYIPEILGTTNIVKISRDGINREDVNFTKISDHIIEIETSHFSYFKITTSTPVTPPQEDSDRWRYPPPPAFKDVCPAQRDCSDSYYDRLCGPCPLIDKKLVKTTDNALCSIENSKLSTELNGAYQRACGYDITTMPTIQKADMEGKLLRKDMAKMISNFAINIMDKDISTGVRCEFDDMTKLPKEAQYYAIAACRLWLMGYESDGKRTKHTFDPNTEVDRAQFGTILSRLIRGDKNNGGDIYYQRHLEALKKEWIMTKIDKPLSKELRGRVMVMMKRIFDKK